MMSPKRQTVFSPKLKSNQPKATAEQVVKDIRRATRRHYSTEDKIRIVLSGLRGEDSIAELCRKEGIAQGLYYSWSKEFLEAGKKRLAGDTARAATSDEVRSMRTQCWRRLNLDSECRFFLDRGRAANIWLNGC